MGCCWDKLLYHYKPDCQVDVHRVTGRYQSALLVLVCIRVVGPHACAFLRLGSSQTVLQNVVTRSKAERLLVFRA